MPSRQVSCSFLPDAPVRPSPYSGPVKGHQQLGGGRIFDNRPDLVVEEFRHGPVRLGVEEQVGELGASVLVAAALVGILVAPSALLGGDVEGLVGDGTIGVPPGECLHTSQIAS